MMLSLAWSLILYVCTYLGQNWAIHNVINYFECFFFTDLKAFLWYWSNHILSLGWSLFFLAFRVCPLRKILHGPWAKLSNQLSFTDSIGVLKSKTCSWKDFFVNLSFKNRKFKWSMVLMYWKIGECATLQVKVQQVQIFHICPNWMVLSRSLIR